MSDVKEKEEYILDSSDEDTDRTANNAGEESYRREIEDIVKGFILEKDLMSQGHEDEMTTMRRSFSREKADLLRHLEEEREVLRQNSRMASIASNETGYGSGSHDSETGNLNIYGGELAGTSTVKREAMSLSSGHFSSDIDHNLIKEIAEVYLKMNNGSITCRVRPDLDIEDKFEREREVFERKFVEEKRELKRKSEEDYNYKLEQERSRYEGQIQELKSTITDLQWQKRDLESHMRNEKEKKEIIFERERNDLEKRHLQTVHDIKRKIEDKFSVDIENQKDKYEENISELQEDISKLTLQLRELNENLRQEKEIIVGKFERENKEMEQTFLDQRNTIKLSLESEFALKLENETTVLKTINKKLKDDFESLEREKREIEKKHKEERRKLEEHYEEEISEMEKKHSEEKRNIKIKLEERCQQLIISEQNTIQVTLSELREEVMLLRQENSQIDSAFSDRNEELRQQLDFEREDYRKKLQEDREELKIRMENEFNQKLLNESSGHLELVQQLDRELGITKARYSELEGTMIAIQRERDVLAREREEIQRKFMSMEFQLEKKTDISSGQQSSEPEIDKLRETVRRKDQEIATANLLKEQTEIKMSALRREKMELEDEVANFKRKYTATGDEKRIERPNVDNSEVVSLQESARRKDDEMQNLKRDKFDQEARICSLQRKNEEMEDELSALRRKKLEVEDEISSIKRDKSDSDNQISMLRKEKIQLEENIGTLKRKQVELEDIVSALRRENMEREHEIALLKRTIDAMQEEVDTHKLRSIQNANEQNYYQQRSDMGSSQERQNDAIFSSKPDRRCEDEITQHAAQTVYGETGKQLDVSSGSLEGIGRDVEELEHQKRQLETTVQRLEANKTTLERNITNLEQRNDSASLVSESSRAIERDIDELKRQKRQLETTVQRLEDNKATLEKNITNLEQRNDSASRVSESSKAIERDIDELKRQKRQLETTVQRLEDNKATLERNITNLEQRNDSASLVSESSKAIERDIDELERKKRQLENTVRRLEDNKATLERNITNLEQRNNSASLVSESSKAIERDIDELERQKRQLEITVQRLEDNKATLERNINNLEQRNNSASLVKRDIDELEGKKRQIETTVRQLEDNKLELEKHITNLKNLSDSTSVTLNQKDDLEEKLGNLKEEYVDLENRISRLRREENGLEGHVTDLKNNEQDLNKRINELNIEEHRIDKEIQILQDEKEMLQKSVKNTQQNGNVQQGGARRITGVTQVSIERVRKHEHKDHELAELRKERDSLKKELATLKKNLGGNSYHQHHQQQQKSQKNSSSSSYLTYSNDMTQIEQNEVVTLKKERMQIEKSVAMLMRQKTEIDADIVVIKETKKREGNELTSLRRERMELDTGVTTLQSTKTRLEAELSVLRDKKKKDGSQIDYLQREKYEVEKQFDDLQSKKTKMEAELSMTEKAWKKKGNSTSEFYTDSLDVEKDLKAMRKERTEVESDIKRLQSVRNREEHELGVLRKQMKDLEKQISELRVAEDGRKTQTGSYLNRDNADNTGGTPYPYGEDSTLLLSSSRSQKPRVRTSIEINHSGTKSHAVSRRSFDANENAVIPTTQTSRGHPNEMVNGDSFCNFDVRYSGINSNESRGNGERESRFSATNDGDIYSQRNGQNYPRSHTGKNGEIIRPVESYDNQATDVNRSRFGQGNAASRSSLADSGGKEDNDVRYLRREKCELESQVSDLRIQLTKLQADVSELENIKVVKEALNGRGGDGYHGYHHKDREYHRDLKTEIAHVTLEEKSETLWEQYEEQVRELKEQNMVLKQKVGLLEWQVENTKQKMEIQEMSFRRELSAVKEKYSTSTGTTTSSFEVLDSDTTKLKEFYQHLNFLLVKTSSSEEILRDIKTAITELEQHKVVNVDDKNSSAYSNIGNDHLGMYSYNEKPSSNTKVDKDEAKAARDYASQLKIQLEIADTQLKTCEKIIHRLYAENSELNKLVAKLENRLKTTTRSTEKLQRKRVLLQKLVEKLSGHVGKDQLRQAYLVLELDKDISI